MRTYVPEDFTRGLLLELFQNASRAWWIKRAQDFERAKPIVGDPADHTPEALDRLRRAWTRCDEVARACRAKAEIVASDIDVFDQILTDLIELDKWSAP